jgi:hypothetical protein
MADNVVANAGSGGSTFATDDIAGVHYPRTKMVWGADGAVNDTSAAAPLPVGDAGGSLTVDNAALSVTGGGVEATALRVTLASDSTGVVSVDDNGASLTVDNAALSVVGGGVEATALRVTLASDSTGVLSVDDNGGTLTVDGTVTAVGAAADGAAVSGNPVLVAGYDGTNVQTLLTNASGHLQVTALDGGGALTVDDGGSSLTVDGTVTANLAAGTNNIGDVDVLSIAAGDNNIGNVDLASAIPAGTNLIGVVAAGLSTSAIYAGTTASTPKFAIIDAATSGDNTLVAAVASNKIRVLAAFLVSAGTVTARFESGAGGTALSGQMNLVANSGFVLPFSPVGWFETGVNTLLNLELSGAVSVDGSIVYIEVA